MEILGGFIIFAIHDDNNDKYVYLKYCIKNRRFYDIDKLFLEVGV